MGTPQIDSMIRWLDEHQHDGMDPSIREALEAEDPRTWREVFDAGVVSEQDVVNAWLGSQAQAKEAEKKQHEIEQKERDKRSVQSIASALWNVATSEDRRLSSGDSRTYRHLEIALIDAIRVVYHVNRKRANQVRDLLAEYGPDDSLYGTEGRGIASYVQFALQHDEEDRF